MATITVSIDRQIAAVRRELGMRRHAYPRWVAERRMTQATAELEIAAMEAVLETLERVQREARPELPGFA